MYRKLSVCLLLLALCGLPLPQASFAATDSGTILTGKVVTTVTRAEPMPFHGILDEVLVKPGDSVKQGDVLIRYHLKAEAERLLQREVTTGAATETLKGQVLDLERQMAQTDAQRNKNRQLVASGLGSRQSLGRLEDDVQSLRNRIALLRSTIKKNESNFAERLKELEGYFGVPIKEGEELPRTLILRSPIDGYVLSLSDTLNPGNVLPQGSLPVSIGRLDPMLIRVPVYEAEVSGIKEGDTATVEIPSLSDKKFSATVSEIAWVSNDMNVANPSYYTVELTVPNPDLELKPGFKAVVRFKAGK